MGRSRKETVEGERKRKGERKGGEAFFTSWSSFRCRPAFHSAANRGGEKKEKKKKVR